MQPNYLAILVAVVLQFIVGFVWYGPIFGNLWEKMHGFNKLSKEVQEKMMKQMGPYYALQFFVTLVTTIVLAIFITNLPDWNAYAMAGFFWIGFFVPTQVSGVVFGGTEPKWMLKKILVQASAALICVEVAATVIHAML